MTKARPFREVWWARISDNAIRTPWITLLIQLGVVVGGSYVFLFQPMSGVSRAPVSEHAKATASRNAVSGTTERLVTGRVPSRAGSGQGLAPGSELQARSPSGKPYDVKGVDLFIDAIVLTAAVCIGGGLLLLCAVKLKHVMKMRRGG